MTDSPPHNPRRDLIYSYNKDVPRSKHRPPYALSSIQAIVEQSGKQRLSRVVQSFSLQSKLFSPLETNRSPSPEREKGLKKVEKESQDKLTALETKIEEVKKKIPT